MGNLRNLFDKLNDSRYCRFTENGIYPVKEMGQIIKLSPEELLEIGRTYPDREHLMIAYFGETPTRILYLGENAKSMAETVDSLRIPNSWPSNLGEKVFYLFRGHLKYLDSGPVSLEQEVVSGKEHQFELVLKRLIEVYSASEQKEFYAAEKFTLSGEVLS